MLDLSFWSELHDIWLKYKFNFNMKLALFMENGEQVPFSCLQTNGLKQSLSLLKA